MAEAILDLIESIRLEEASVERLFGGEGQRTATRTGRATPKYMQALTEAGEFIADLYAGRRRSWQFREAMSRSDFPLYFGDILDRVLLANYQAYPVIWDRIALRNTAPDFRTLNRFYFDGGDEGVTEVPELTEYPETKLNEGKYQVSIKKYGKRIGWSWESNINDDMEVFQRAPVALARGARRTENRFVTDLFVGPNGPDAALYSGGNGNIVTANPAFSADALTAAFAQIGNMTYQGEPIFVEAVTLVVPPALRVKAEMVLNAATVEVTGAAAGAGANMTMVAANWLRQSVTLVVNPYIPILSTTANGNTSWFLFADPRSDRPALEVDFLRGRESPELFQKSPNALRVGGGLVDPTEGSYETDAIDFKVRHVFGGGIIDPKMTVSSNGSGV